MVCHLREVEVSAKDPLTYLSKFHRSRGSKFKNDVRHCRHPKNLQMYGTAQKKAKNDEQEHLGRTRARTADYG